MLILPLVWSFIQIAAGIGVYFAARHTQSIWTFAYAFEVPVTLVLVVRYVNKFRTDATAISYRFSPYMQGWFGMVWATKTIADTFNPQPHYYEGIDHGVLEAAWQHHDHLKSVSVLILSIALVTGILGIGGAQCILMARQAKKLAAQIDPVVQL